MIAERVWRLLNDLPTSETMLAKLRAFGPGWRVRNQRFDSNSILAFNFRIETIVVIRATTCVSIVVCFAFGIASHCRLESQRWHHRIDGESKKHFVVLLFLFCLKIVFRCQKKRQRKKRVLRQQRNLQTPPLRRRPMMKSIIISRTKSYCISLDLWFVFAF